MQKLINNGDVTDMTHKHVLVYEFTLEFVHVIVWVDN